MFEKQSFLKRQILQVKKQNFIFYILSKFFKLIKLFIDILIYLLIFPIFLVICLISFIYPIRFGQINNNVVGHYIFDVEYFLSYKKKNRIKSLDFFFFTSNKSVNSFWDIIVKRNLNVSFIHKYFFFLSKYLSKKNIVILNSLTVRDTLDVLYSTPIQIKFTDEEINNGLDYLKKMGKKTNQKYICVVNRDDAYRKKYFGDNILLNSKESIIYHKHRNSNIENYKEAINYFIEKGFFVIRMGKTVEKKLNINNKNFIDYPNSEFRSDFLDIFLFYNSYLNLVSESGILLTSMIFRKPMCSVNCAEIGGLQTWHDKNIIIFKKYWSKKNKRYLSLEEIIKLSKNGLNSRLVKNRMLLFEKWKKTVNKNLFISFNDFIKKNRIKNKIIMNLDSDGKLKNSNLDLPLGNYGLIEIFRDNDIDIIDNSPEEIKEVCEELVKRISGEWVEKKDDKHLQENFWKKFPKDLYSHGKIRSKIGNNFLRKNNFILGN